MSVPRHTAYNLAGGLLPLALSLVTIPLYISLIGEVRYGVLAIAWLLLGYFGLFDLGLGVATAQRIASLGPDEGQERSQVFWTALAMNSGLGVAGGVLLLPVAWLYFASSSVNIDPALRLEIAQAVPLLAVALPVATVSGVLTGALQGRSRFLELNAVSVAGAVLTQTLPLLIAWTQGPRLAWLLGAVVVSRVVVVMLLFWRCSRHVLAGGERSLSRLQAKGLLRFGGWVTLTSLVGPLMVVLDRFAIGGLLGPRAVTHYTVPFQLAERTTLLPTALSSALFPRLASLNSAQGRQLAATAIRSLAVVMTPVTATGILLLHPFLAWWLTPGFAREAGLSGQVLLLGFWCNAMAYVPFALLQAAGRPDVVAKCHVVEVLPYLALLWVGLHVFGTAGAALVFALRTLADCLLLMHFAGNLSDSLRLLARPALLLLAAFAVTLVVPAAITVAWFAAAGLVIAVSLAWALKSAPPELRQLVRGRLANRRSSL